MNHEPRVVLRGLGPSVPIFVGGRGIESYKGALDEIGAIVEPDLAAFNKRLREPHDS
jgi:hypothetical protein